MLGQELLHHLLRSLMKYVGKPGQRISLSADPKELVQLLTKVVCYSSNLDPERGNGHRTLDEEQNLEIQYT